MARDNGLLAPSASVSQYDLINFIFGIANKLRGPYERLRKGASE